MKKFFNVVMLLVIVTGLSCSIMGKCTSAPKPVTQADVTVVDSSLFQQWVLKKLNGKDVVREKAGNEIPYIKLQQNGNAISGSTGCNQVYGKFVMNGDEITFSGMSITKMFCPDATYEIDFSNILFQKEPFKFKINGNSLAIISNGVEMMLLEKK